MTSNPIPIHNSDQSSFLSCRRAWNLSSILRQAYRPIETPTPLRFGMCMHIGYQTIYSPVTWNVDKELVLKMAQSEFLNAMKLTRDDYLKKSNREALDDEQKAEYDMLCELGTNMLELYAMTAARLDTEMGLTPLGVEEDWEVPLGFSVQGSPVVFRFRTDLRCMDSHGDMWLVDHKTTAKMDQVDFLDMDPQMGKYLAGLRLLGMPVVGAIYNEQYKGFPAPPVRLKTVRKGCIFSTSKSQDTTYELYIKTLEEEGESLEPYQEYLDWLKSAQEVKQWVRRTIVRRSENELANQMEITKAIAIDQLDDPMIYPSPSKFKCNWCAFRAPCLQMNEGSDYEYTLNTNYQRVTTHYGHVI